MTVTILPIAKTIFVDANGVPLASGKVYTYVPNTSTFKTSWQDSGATIPNANPIILDSSGGCYLWGNGAYRELVQDSLGNTIFDAVTADLGSAILATFNGTSTTSVAIATGSKTFTTQTGLQFFPGGTVNIASSASALNYMNGTVTSYNTSTGALVVNVLTDGGSGTHADWNIAVSGIQGPPGTVTAISIASTNGFAGSSSGGGTPALTISTTVNGIAKGNGTTLTAASVGSDYSGGTAANATGIVKSTFGTGALTTAVAGDFPTLNQDTTGTASHVTTNANLTGPVTSVGNATAISNGVVTEAMQLLSDNTTANVSISAHGYAPKLPNNASVFLNGTGGYSVPVTTSALGTSTSSLLIGTGSKTFVTQSGLSITAGQYIIASSMANAANYMYGQVTSYSGTSLVLNVSVVGGSGTDADWSLFFSGPPGASGSVSTSGSPTTGNLTKFSSSSAITNADLTGDITTSGGVATTLATVNSNVGTFASATFNGKGLATAAAAISGDITTSGAVSTLATVNSNVGTFTNATLTVNGKGLVTAASSGTPLGWVLLTKTNASSAASIAFSATYITNAYNRYVVKFDSLYASGTNAIFGMTVSTNNGSGYLNSNYINSGTLQQLSSATINGDHGTTTFIDLTASSSVLPLSSSSSYGTQGTIEFSNPSAAQICTYVSDIMLMLSGTATDNWFIHNQAYNTTTTATNNIKFSDVSGNGNTLTGNFYLYGIAGT